MAAFLVPGPVAAHNRSSPPERYFAHRCNDSTTAGVLACIHRASIHWEQNYAEARAIATRESTLHPGLCNGERPGGPQVPNRLGRACGLFQFMPGTWAFTPQGRAGESRFSAKYASLAAMWMWAHGYKSHWACC